MDLGRVDLNLLVAFDALMDQRSVTRAAERLCVGQSAMSATLARLRTLFNDQILVRQGRRLVATPVAESLVDPIHEILFAVSSALARCGTFDPQTDARTFSIIASDYLTIVFLRRLSATLPIEAPNVKLHIRPVSVASMDDLRQNKTDLLITAREAFPPNDEFPYEPLFTDRYVCAVDAANSLVGDTLTIEQFQSLPYLATSAGHAPSFGDLELDRLGIARNTEISTSYTLGMFMLPGSKLVSLVHERLGKQFEQQLNIKLLEPPFQLRHITEVMIWSQRNTDDPGHSWLRQRLAKLAQTMIADES